MAAAAIHRLFNPATWVGAILYGILILALAIAAAKLVRVWSHRIATRSDLRIDQTAVNFIGQFLQLFCFLLAVIVYADLVPALNQVGSAMLASAGVISLVVGLAAQNTLGQLIAGIALLLYRPFSIGDVLVVTAQTMKETGIVREFTLGYTKLETEDGRWLVVPNSVMASMIIVKVK
jgi:small-conductance mechanosensitive channel